MIPNEAVEAAARALRKLSNGSAVERAWESTGQEWIYRNEAFAALEAAAPYMLSHERQQTADAHRDAIVNRDTVDRLERELETAKADAWDEAAASIIDEHGNPIKPTNVNNPYRSQA